MSDFATERGRGKELERAAAGERKESGRRV